MYGKTIVTSFCRQNIFAGKGFSRKKPFST